jgi:multidrug resistance efflux pump
MIKIGVITLIYVLVVLVVVVLCIYIIQEIKLRKYTTPQCKDGKVQEIKPTVRSKIYKLGVDKNE